MRDKLRKLAPYLLEFGALALCALSLSVALPALLAALLWA